MSTRIFRIPLANIPQSFTIDLAGRSFQMVSRWNDVAGAWFIDLFDGATQKPVILSMPLVAGADLLAQYRHLGIPGSLVALVEGDVYADPTLENLGAEGRLLYVVEQ